MSFDADEEILQDFLVEAGEILEQLSEQLVELESRPDDMALLNAIFRGFHTVKGGAGFLQLNELVECCAVGMGFALWRLSMFRDQRLRRPWFQTRKDPMMSQDLFFWDDARQNGYRCAVDCGVKVGHMDPASGFVW